ncbi:hypothetical protein [Desulfatiglans anilini]|uniref:hypothetical protein n=1 Tax=Desulfatiglans anilini TaxID=90728 RepID=UPI00048176D1|nr:hypothetical protein [Desulfatiglans anilini]
MRSCKGCWIPLTVLGLVSLAVMPARGETKQNPFPSLVSFLDEYVGIPFRTVGRVKEAGDDRLLIEKGAVPLKVGEWLCISKEDPDRSPALKAPAAWVVLETVSPETALVRVVDAPGAPLSPGDRVVTPPPPRIQVRGDVLRPGGAPFFDGLVQELLSKGYYLDMHADGREGPPAQRHDLKLELMRGEGVLICRLSTVEEGRVIFYRTAQEFSSGGSIYPGGAQGAAQPEAMSRSSSGDAPAESSAPSFQHSKPARSLEHFRLQEPASRVAACRLEAEGAILFACLGERDLIVYQAEDGVLKAVGRLRYPHPGIIPLHLHACDLDADGGDELLLTMTLPVMTLDKQDNRLMSSIVTFRDGVLTSVAEELPYYLRVIQDAAGGQAALAQKEGDYRQYDGPIYRLKWNEASGAPDITEPYAPAAGVYSLYQFNPAPGAENRVIILEKDGSLHGYVTPEERLAAFGEVGLGNYEVTTYPLKLEEDIFIGGFDRRAHDDVYTARRFEMRKDFDGQVFTISKGRRGMLAGFAEKLVAGRRDYDQLVAVKWLGDRIRQTWESDQYEKDLIDFTFLKDPGRILILYQDADGCALEAVN